MAIIAPRRRALQTARATVLLLLIGLASPLAGANDAARQEKALGSLKARIAELDRELEKDRRDQDSLQRELQAAEQARAEAASAAREADSALGTQRQRLAAAQQATARARNQAEARLEDLLRALRAGYMAGNPGRLQLVFRLQDTQGLDRLDADTAALARALQTRLDTLRAAIDELARTEQVLAGEQQQLEVHRQSSREALGRLEETQAERKRRLDALAQRQRDRADQLRQAKAEQARVEKLLRSLREALQDSPMKFERGVPFQSQRGRLPWPLRGPLIARFGAAKGDGPLTWNGWWIGGGIGAPVRAVADGRVVYVGWMQRYGLIVIIDHPGQYLSLYGHLQDAQAKVGQVVTAGTRIASAGNSGGHDRSGVYFEIRAGSSAVDPRSWLTP